MVNGIVKSSLRQGNYHSFPALMGVEQSNWSRPIMSVKHIGLLLFLFCLSIWATSPPTTHTHTLAKRLTLTYCDFYDEMCIKYCWRKVGRGCYSRTWINMLLLTPNSLQRTVFECQTLHSSSHLWNAVNCIVFFHNFTVCASCTYSSLLRVRQC